MEEPALIIINIFKGFIAIGIIAVFLAFVSFIVTYLIEILNFREEKAHFSTSVGNALLVIHSIFEPGRKPQAEQIIWIRKRKTPLEKNLSGLTELEYDKLIIKGIKIINNKKYKLRKC